MAPLSYYVILMIFLIILEIMFPAMLLLSGFGFSLFIFSYIANYHYRWVGGYIPIFSAFSTIFIVYSFTKIYMIVRKRINKQMKTLIGNKAELLEVINNGLARVKIGQKIYLGRFKLESKPGEIFFVRYVNRRNEFVLRRNKHFTKDAEDESD